jgi:hypothetical protein
MGGMIFVLAAVLGTVLFARLDRPMVIVALWTMVAMGVLGGYDDRIKLLGIPDPANPGRTMRGMRLKPKLAAQAVISLVAITWLWLEMRDVPGWATLHIPGLAGATLPIGIGVIAIGIFTLVGISNAVNLTDGLDGLAAGCGTIVVLVMAVVAYLVGRVDTAGYLGQVFVPGAGEMTVFLSALAGAERKAASSGGTATRRRSSWGTRVRSRSAARSPSRPWRCARNSCSSSRASRSSGRRCPSSSRWRPSAGAAASGSSSSPRTTTTSRSSAGPNRAW